MELKTQTFKRKPFYVEGVQVTIENIFEVAKWCGGEVKKKNDVEPGVPEIYIQVPVKKAAHVRQTQAFHGDMVLKAGRGFKVYTQAAFDRSFEPVGLPEPVVFVDPSNLDPMLNLKEL